MMPQIPCFNLISIQIIKYYKIKGFQKIPLHCEYRNLSINYQETAIIFIPGVMKTGSANLNFLFNFSQRPLSKFSLFTVLFTADVDFFRFF